MTRDDICLILLRYDFFECKDYAKRWENVLEVFYYFEEEYLIFMFIFIHSTFSKDRFSRDPPFLYLSWSELSPNLFSENRQSLEVFLPPDVTIFSCSATVSI